ncbi:MAG: transglutaminase family protein [Candidatus Rhabdochlamydia sp.]
MWYVIFFLFPCLIYAAPLSLQDKLMNLDPLSISEHLSFYDLYPEEEEGKKALSHAWALLSCRSETKNSNPLFLPSVDLKPLITLITERTSSQKIVLTSQQLQAIDTLSSHFYNRSLPGHYVWTKEELFKLPSEDIDLSRGLLIEQFNEDKEQIMQYEASLDLMALQIQARTPKDAAPQELIQKINHFIFHEMRFHFPPHSLYAKDIDLYTFLPSVMDSREGVCLGVSILYLSLAQRLGLPLEIITPPGHIYVRYQAKDTRINIETTARGVNYPDDLYLGIDTRKLQQRTLKEVIGFAYINQASVAWGLNDFKTAVTLYQKARIYLPHDPLLNLLEGINSLFIGKIQEGRALLSPLRNFTFDWAVSPETLADDYFAKKVDIEGIKALFSHVDETRESILCKQKQLDQVLKKYPHFRSGLFQRAICLMQLGSLKEAEQALESYHKLDPSSATVEYYLAVIAKERLNYKKAWKHYKIAEELLAKREHQCAVLQALRNDLKGYLIPFLLHEKIQ